MKLYKIVEVTSGPPPEFGMTRDILVIAGDDEDALRIANVKEDDVLEITEISLNEPKVIHNEYR